jgi:P-type Cu2+ transporter
MSATALTARAPHDMAAARVGLCNHCGEPLPAVPVAAAAPHELFCCAGCAAAADWIHRAHLDDYYRLRSAAAGRVSTDPVDLAAWDREDVVSPYVREVAQGREIVFATDGMRCAACAWLIDRALSREEGVAEVSANAVTGRIRLVWDPARTVLSAILGRLQRLGYRPWLAGSLDREHERRREWHRWLLRLGLAGIVAVQTMMFSEALYLDTAGQMPVPTRDFFRWLAFLLATPVVFYAGYPFLAGAWRELSQRRAGMDTLVAASTLLAWGASTWETVRGGPQVWFDAAVMFVFLLLAARVLELRARQIANQRIDALAGARPVLAQRERTGGGAESVPASRLRPGDTLRVAAGEHLPADGVLLDRAADFNEALLTGEFRPAARQPGDTVLAGSLCAQQAVRMRVTASGAATRLSALEQLVHAAQAHRPRIAAWADRVASWFVLGLVLITAGAYLYWHATQPQRALEVALAMLVISCPCALSLAVPAALAAAYSRLSELGVLVLRTDALEKLARVDTVLFDKTGTLGQSNWRIARTDVFGTTSREEAAHLAAALERDARHPLASAFQQADDGRPAAGSTRYPGLGLEGEVGQRTLRLGTAGFAAGRPDDGAVWLGDGSAALARFELDEQPREETARLLRALSDMGLRLQILSGDARDAVEKFASRLGTALERVEGRLLPEDKLARVHALQQAGRRVAMVGDGINDAPVLAGADVSLAVCDAAALARQSADLVLLHPSLERVADAVAVARRTRGVIRQNLAWAICYNLVALPVAALGHIAPWAAALTMVVSSLTVTLNALRLAARHKP